MKKETETKTMRPELIEMIRRHAFGLDENRPDAVAKRQKKNQRTARANVEDLCDAGSFIEYGALAIAAQRGRRSEEDLISKTPADGMIAGVGPVNGSFFAEGADKAAKLMQICQAHGLPILSLCDTPGFMVGPEIEKRAQVRHVCRMFVIGSHLTVPYFTVVLRRGYGLGAMAMTKGGFHESFFTAAWPAGEFGAMGIEGAIKAGFKKELAAIEDPAQREKLYEQLVGELYKRGKAINMASYLEIDSVIDPADTRKWIMQGIKSVPVQQSSGVGHNFIDPW
jgi:acetyl-CoA carboxylase carboxyltransferase component